MYFASSEHILMKVIDFRISNEFFYVVIVIICQINLLIFNLELAFMLGDILGDTYDPGGM